MRRTMRSRFSMSLLLSDVGVVLMIYSEPGVSTIGAMRNSQGSTLLLLALAVVLFFFSLSLLPAVEMYCRFRRPALILLALQIALLAFRFRDRNSPERALVIATYVFSALGIAFTSLLLATAKGRC